MPLDSRQLAWLEELTQQGGQSRLAGGHDLQPKRRRLVLLQGLLALDPPQQGPELIPVQEVCFDDTTSKGNIQSRS